MKWIASDGTELELGGKVTGNGPVAKSLRVTLAAHEDYGCIRVTTDALPEGRVILDPNDPRHMGPLLREAAWPLGHTLISEPDLGDASAEPRPALPGDGVY